MAIPHQKLAITYIGGDDKREYRISSIPEEYYDVDNKWSIQDLQLVEKGLLEFVYFTDQNDHSPYHKNNVLNTHGRILERYLEHLDNNYWKTLPMYEQMYALKNIWIAERWDLEEQLLNRMPLHDAKTLWVYSFMTYCQSIGKTPMGYVSVTNLPYYFNRDGMPIDYIRKDWIQELGAEYFCNTPNDIHAHNDYIEHLYTVYQSKDPLIALELSDFEYSKSSVIPQLADVIIKKQSKRLFQMLYPVLSNTKRHSDSTWNVLEEKWYSRISSMPHALEREKILAMLGLTPPLDHPHYKEILPYVSQLQIYYPEDSETNDISEEPYVQLKNTNKNPSAIERWVLTNSLLHNELSLDEVLHYALNIFNDKHQNIEPLHLDTDISH